MTRVVLDEGLQNLQTRMIELAREIKNALSIILTALKTGEHLGLHEIIAHSSTIAGTCAATEQQALRLLILQQPLAGQDLRCLTAALFISDHFGRIGSSIVQVAQTLLQAASLYRQMVDSSLYSVEGHAVDQQGHLTEVFILRGLLLLGEEIEYIFSTAVEAFALRDAVKARTLESGCSLVELRYAPICQDIQEMQAQMSGLQDALLLQRLTALLWIAHKFAEMATDVTNICKRIIFIVEG